MIEAPIYPELEFEEKDHIYRLNGLVIPNGLRSHLYTSEDICATRKFPGFGGKK